MQQSSGVLMCRVSCAGKTWLSHTFWVEHRCIDSQSLVTAMWLCRFIDICVKLVGFVDFIHSYHIQYHIFLLYVGVVLFRSNMCVWHTTELQVMTLFVTLKVNTGVENSVRMNCFTILSNNQCWSMVPKLVESWCAHVHLSCGLRLIRSHHLGVSMIMSAQWGWLKTI